MGAYVFDVRSLMFEVAGVFLSTPTLRHTDTPILIFPPAPPCLSVTVSASPAPWSGAMSEPRFQALAARGSLLAGLESVYIMANPVLE